jgi:hypothetical protein
VREIYENLSHKEKALVWTAAVTAIVLLIAWLVSYAGIVAAAQIGATFGTLAIAVLAFRQVGEMREARLAQEKPQVIVDADYSNPPFVYVVVHNIGKGAAKDIAFEFSNAMTAPEGVDNPAWVSPDKQGYFERGIPYLAPGAEIRNFWGSMPTLAPFLREQAP